MVNLDDFEKKYLELSKKINIFQETINKKFKTAGMLFDHLKNKIYTIGRTNDKLSRDKMNNSNILENCIYCEGEKYFCSKYEKREKCIIQGVIRKAGFDICFDVEDNTDKCKHLIELK